MHYDRLGYASKRTFKTTYAELAKLRVEQKIGKRVLLLNIRRGKYAGRVIAEIFSEDGKNISDYLLERNLALLYGKETGFKKIDWCK